MTHPLLRFAAAALATAAFAATLSACTPLVLGGAAVGTLVALDRRTSGAQLEDEGIELRAASRIRDALGERAHVNVSSYNRQVLLTGEVPSEADKQQVAQIVSRVENVKGIYNELGVMGNSSLSQRSSDTLVTGKVKASLVDARDLSVNAFRVITERGTVYMMGRVTQREADRASQIARTVGGVQRVVRLFDIISEEELQRIAPRPTAASSSAN
ncbi:BON domain-containing protein [Ramlibacter tataouinensis]|uniref:BON domain-containing protein n=1 Tax=Ramlibacter tataouinensis TaxID=94132 RepID=UPI0022F3EAEE|nr:BON domain-containing protein [Ramlibacter tataouinensis]WBY00388.1 BON domain-containing protein [Ramlibacter tataouinensis]